MADKPTLSREYLYVPLTQINFDVADLDVNQMAFTDAGIEPTEPDWITAIVVDDTSPLFDASIGESIALLVGPERGDVVTTEELGAGDYQVWIDVSVPSSDERVVRVAGTLTVSATGA